MEAFLIYFHFDFFSLKMHFFSNLIKIIVYAC